MAAAERRQPGHGRRVGRRPRAVAVGPLRRRGLRHQHAHGEAAASHQGGQRSARHGRLAAARPLLDRPHRHPALTPQGARGRGRSTSDAGRRRSPPSRARARARAERLRRLVPGRRAEAGRRWLRRLAATAVGRQRPAGARRHAVPDQRAARAPGRTAADREPAAGSRGRGAFAGHGQAQVLRARRPRRRASRRADRAAGLPADPRGREPGVGRDDQEHAGVDRLGVDEEPGPPGEHPRAGLPRDRHRDGLRGARGAAGAEAGGDLHHDVRRRRALAPTAPAIPLGMLEVADLARRYGDVVALDGLSFTVEPGQLFGFVGPNGAGKTTTMRIILGVLEPDAGSVRWRGAPVDLATRARFGYMPEERGLYPKMRVRDQLEYFASLHGLSRPDALAATDGWLERLGIADRAGDRVEALSLGNQQRVQLGAVLVHDPELLVLDEPFSGLDPVGVDVLSGVLRELADGGVPVLFSSHQLELVERLCESVAIVKDGRLVASGKVDDLRSAGAAALTVRVAVAGGGEEWLAAVPGAEVVDRGPAGVLVALQDGAGPEAVLDAARAAGTVTHFAVERPTLSELFRKAVAA